MCWIKTINWSLSIRLHLTMLHLKFSKSSLCKIGIFQHFFNSNKPMLSTKAVLINCNSVHACHHGVEHEPFLPSPLEPPLHHIRPPPTLNNLVYLRTCCNDNIREAIQIKNVTNCGKCPKGLTLTVEGGGLNFSDFPKFK